MLDTPFYIDNQEKEKKDKAVSFGITVGLHLLLILFLYFFLVKTPNPPFEENEGGMAINFGSSDVGSGDVQPLTYTPVEAVSANQSASTPSVSDESVVTQNVEDAFAMEDKKAKEKPTVKPKPVEDALFKPSKNTNTSTKTEKPTVDNSSLFNPGAFGKPNNSKGDGEGGGKGDQGDPNGDPNATSYKGGGTGNGSGKGNGLGDGNVRLVGRNVVNRYVPKNPCEQSRGKVMISIRVDQQGRVVAANFSQGGSTTGDDCLINVAKQAAMKYTFDAKADAAEFQTGSILFTFKEN